MTLLADRERRRREARVVLFDATREALRTALRELAPGCRFWLYGSLTRRGRFHLRSDVDLAYASLPEDTTEYRFASELEERLRRPVDLVAMDRTRLREKILREGESWTG